MSEAKSYTFSVRVENKFGVLSRIAGLFSGRGYNISSLTVNSTCDPDVSRMIIVTKGDDAVIEQIEKQLNKLIEVIKVDRLSGEDFIEREIALFTIAADTPEKKTQLIQLVEISGRASQIDNFMKMVSDIGIVDMARSGRVAIPRS